MTTTREAELAVDYVFRVERAGGETAVVSHKPRLVTNDMAALREAAIVGVAQLPAVMIYEDVAAGRLVHILPQWCPKAGVVHAVFPSRRRLLPSVRGLLDFLARECSAARAAADRVTGNACDHPV
jgi:DNA-binding transcriptional LysR family regulator